MKVHGGTANSGEPSLCLTCRFATIVKGPRLGDEIVDCRRLSDGHGRIAFPVTACTGYSDSRQPSIYEMEDLAWILRSDPKRSVIGFVKGSTLKPQERHILPDEWD